MKSQFRFRDTLFVLLILMALLSFFDAIAEFGFSMWLPTFLQEEKGFPILQVGVITSVWGLGQTFGRPVLGLVGDRIGYRRVGTPAAFIMALSFYCIVTSQAYGSFVFWQLTAGFIGAGVMGSLWPFTAVLFGKLKGTALGLLSNVAQLGAAAAPILCGYVGERVSLGKGLLLISVIPSAMVGLLFLMSYFWVRADLPQDLRGCFAESPG
jgi:MFS family permease